MLVDAGSVSGYIASLANSRRLPHLGHCCKSCRLIIVILGCLIIELLEETSVHEVDHVTGGIQVRCDLVVDHLVKPNIPQLRPQFRTRNNVFRALH